jgi:hypothetical protein
MEATTNTTKRESENLFDNFKFTSLEDFKFMSKRPEKDGKLEDCASN